MPSASDPSLVETPRSRVRLAEPSDVVRIVTLVQELAAYEKEPDAVEATEEHFRRALFPEVGAPTTFCHVAEVETAPGEWDVVGMAVWYVTFSTWLGVNGLWLEDLFVRPEQRGLGLGQALLRTLAQVCVERGYGRLEWWVLDWNEPAIGFYRSLGAEAMDEWTVHRVSGADLTALAASGSR